MTRSLHAVMTGLDPVIHAVRPARTSALLAGSLVALGLTLLATSTHAATLDTVHRTNTVHCGAAPRAGIADAAEDGRITGLAVDLCRALTIATLGPSGRSEFHLYDSERDYDAVRTGADDLAFLTPDAVSTHALAATVIPGPPVFIAELSALVQPGPGTLADTTVCFMNGSPAHQALEAWADHTHTALVRIGFQEDIELQDAFDARRCGAMAGEASELAEFRAASPTRATARILPPLAVMPVLATAPVGDGPWASLVAWTMAAVVQSETAPSPWRSDLPGTTLAGLRPGWQAEVTAALGSYPAMLDRNLGTKSNLALRPGPNATWPEGLLLPPGPH